MNHPLPIIRWLFVAACVLIPAAGSAQVPQLINYQGRVAVGTVNFDGTGQFKFALVNTNGSTTYWSNDGTSTNGSQPAASVSLTVAKGLYSVLLGDASISHMTVIPNAVFNNSDVRLRVWFNDGVHDFQLLTPDQRIAAVGYAMMAATAQTVPDGAITSSKIAAGAVGSSQLATNAVQSANIAVNAIQTTHIAAGAIGNTQLASGAVGFSALSKPPQSGTVDGAGLSFDFGQASFSVAFPQAFASTPVVALSLAPTSGSFPIDATCQVVSSTVTQFTGRLSAATSYPLVIDSQGDVGQNANLLVVSGYPAIGYYDYTNGDLKFARANDNPGMFWSAPRTVVSTGDVGDFARMAIVNGNPAFSYYDRTATALAFVRATDATGSTWGAPTTLDSTGDVGQYTSLVVVNGNPAIGYWDATNGNVKFTRASDASGTAAWNTPVIVSYAASGSPGSMAVVNGNPAMSFFDSRSAGMLKFVRASDANGTAWGTPVILQSALSFNFGSSLAVVNGNPAISYSDPVNSKLYYIRATDTSGTAWGSAVIVDSVGAAYSKLVVINGNPAIVYFDTTNRKVKYVRATDASGTVWGAPVAIDSAPTAAYGSVSLALVNSAPAVAYYQGNNVGSFNGDLKYVRQVAPTGLKINWIAIPP